MTALYFNSGKFDFFKAINPITDLYNKKINLHDGLSPSERIWSTKSPPYTNTFHNVNLEDENKKIKQLQKKILKSFPIGARVRLQTTKLEFAKDAMSEKFTTSFYYIYAIKAPILARFPFRFKLKNDKNQPITGLFLKHELKLV